MKTKYINPFLKNIFNYHVLQALFRQTVNGYYYENGWLESVKVKRPIDIEGNPIPWLTYPFTDFIGTKSIQGLTLFEYGSGNSTMYFGSRLKQIVSVDNDKEWHEFVKKKVTSNVQMILEENIKDGLYRKSIHSCNLMFDMILVDGRDRVNCCKEGLLKLNSSGVIILDNSERKEYKEAFVFLKSKGFKHINFYGVAPGEILKGCTTLFYRVENCLEI